MMGPCCLQHCLVSEEMGRVIEDTGSSSPLNFPLNNFSVLICKGNIINHIFASFVRSPSLIVLVSHILVTKGYCAPPGNKLIMGYMLHAHGKDQGSVFYDV